MVFPTIFLLEVPNYPCSNLPSLSSVSLFSLLLLVRRRFVSGSKGPRPPHFLSLYVECFKSSPSSELLSLASEINPPRLSRFVFTDPTILSPSRSSISTMVIYFIIAIRTTVVDVTIFLNCITVLWNATTLVQLRLRLSRKVHPFSLVHSCDVLHDDASRRNIHTPTAFHGG